MYTCNSNSFISYIFQKTIILRIRAKSNRQCRMECGYTLECCVWHNYNNPNFLRLNTNKQTDVVPHRRTTEIEKERKNYWNIERANERNDKQTKQRTKERKLKLAAGTRVSQRTNEWNEEQTNGRKNARTNGRTNGQTNALKKKTRLCWYRYATYIV